MSRKKTSEAAPERKTFHFITGLPRAGSTLLCNILAQNPRFDATATSGIVELVMRIRNQWDDIPEFRAMDHEASDRSKMRCMKAVFEAHHAEHEGPVVFDKSRAWAGYPEVLEEMLDARPKLIVCVRDLCEIAASFEKLFRNTSRLRRTGMEANAVFKSKTAWGRLENLFSMEGMIGVHINHIRDCAGRGYKDCMHFVEYEKLCAKPMTVLRELYDFLDEKEFEHDFDHVKQVTREDDYIHVFLNLHDIRAKVEPQDKCAEKVFDNQVTRPKPHQSQIWKNIETDQYFWRDLKDF